MSELAGISGKEATKAFQRIGYEKLRQRGSHVRLRHPDAHRLPLTIPTHKELKVGLLASSIKDAGLTNKEFLDLL